MGPANEKLLYISEMTDRLLQMSDELNMCMLSYLLRMAKLEAETAELTAPFVSDDRHPPKRTAH
jgi:hypothetical protein